MKPDNVKFKWHEYPLVVMAFIMFWPVILADHFFGLFGPKGSHKGSGAIGVAIAILLAGWAALAAICAIGGLIFLRSH